ncbi:hypothetical protein KY290_000639 [Solanum tuberosum]|uniref:Reverse transcriptase Ty1/copia-type domain-containing protein n=1 Tax=Solanum tuberosum TaxID=4113 RepID=A0ABQ7WJW7_SOLTU|nr:hypothetical protein KY290_000639 [Solanum tuberosum]
MGEKIQVCLDGENGEEAIQPQSENAQDSNHGSSKTSHVMDEQRETVVDSRAPCAPRRPAWMADYEVKGIDPLEDPLTHFSLFSYCDPTNFESIVKDEKWQKAMDDERLQTRIRNGLQRSFFPVVRIDTIRLVIALAAQNSWLVCQLDVKSAFLHRDLQEHLTKDIGGKKVDSTFFEQIVENLMYLSATRPDITYVVSLISRFMENPKKLHLLAAKRILQYLKGAIDFGLVYKKGEMANLIAFSDSDYVGDVADRKSTSSYAFILSSGEVSWSSKKHPIVTLSTTEAEFVAATVCASQAISYSVELQATRSNNKLLDNSSAIKLSRNPVFHLRRKHINEDGVIDLMFCRSEDQVVDIFTKPLKYASFVKLRELLGVRTFVDLASEK